MTSKLTCTHCTTEITGEFQTCKFCQLPTEQLEFAEVFIKCRGNIKEVEKELGISYPTVRNRLEMVIQALGYTFKKQYVDPEDSVQDILDAVEEGSISSKDAIEKLRRIGK
jgi:hypothetical protein